MSEKTAGALLLMLSALSGCGRYADFALPPAQQSGPQAIASQVLTGAPVLTRGAAGEWDTGDVLNPSVVRFGGKLWNFYSGWDGHSWRTGAAVEEDGAWKKLGVVVSPAKETWEGSYIAANGSALADGNQILYWYEAGDPLRIGLARSKDGHTWVKNPTPVMETGPSGSFDERAVADPYVIRAGDAFYMFYLGQNRARIQSLGVARSRDGIRWEKLRSNPLLEPGGAGSFDEKGLGEPAVWTSGGSWWMLYTGRDKGERRRLGLAQSRDGVHWTRDPMFKPIQGGEAWNSQVVCDPHVELQQDGSIRVWYGGGDIARPAENLNGQIGVATLR